MAVTLNAVSMHAVVSGQRGATGASAYESAVAHGYVGTEEEWLASLKGDKGDKGDQGIPGIDAAVVDEALVISTDEITDDIEIGDSEGEVSKISVKGEERDVRDRITEEYALKAFPTDTSTGSIATFPDGADGIPMKSLKVHIEPVQAGEGDPSPDNVRPITGWDAVETVRTGKNLFNIDSNTVTRSGVTYAYDAQTNTLTKSGTAIDTGGVNFGTVTVKTGTYTFSAIFTEIGVGTAVYLRKEDKSTNEGSISSAVPQKTFYLEDGTYYIRVAAVSAGESGGTISEFQLEAGSTATAYEPHHSDTYTTTLPSTIYGGTLDVVTGELVVDMAKVTLTWGDRQGTTLGNTIQKDFMISNVTGVIDASRRPEALCDLASYKENAWNGDFVHFSVGGSLNYQCFIWLPVGTDDSQQFSITYPLATPQTYQLTPQEVKSLLGNNTVYADAGSVEVVYRADTGMFINKKIAEVQAMILEG